MHTSKKIGINKQWLQLVYKEQHRKKKVTDLLRDLFHSVSSCSTKTTKCLESISARFLRATVTSSLSSSATI